MKLRLLFGLVCACVAGTASVRGQSLNQEMPALAGRLNSALMTAKAKSVAAIDFTDLRGNVTELGRQLSERLVVELVMTNGVSMADRANIKSILAEHKLTEEGLVNPANAKKLGEFAGVDVILTGTVSEVEAGWELLVKAISTETAKIVAAGRITFGRTSDNQIAGSRSVGQGVVSAGEGSGLEAVGGGRAIATRDVGALRVEVVGVQAVNVADPSGQAVRGIRVSFNLVNRDTKRVLAIAVNAEPPAPRAWANQSPPVLRAGLLDDRGDQWQLRSMNGVGFVRAGVHGRDGLESYPSSEIVRLLRLRDALGRDVDDPSDGTSSTDGTVAPYGGWPGGKPPFFPYKGNRFISGSTTMIDPGQTVTASLDFVANGGGDGSPKMFQLSAEIVVGIGSADRDKSYSLYNLVFDRVRGSVGGP